MRHGKKNNHLGRTASHRKALLSNLTIALITHKRIITTLAKAKALRKHVEPLISKSRIDTMHSRRTVFSYLNNKEAVKEIFTNIGVKVGDRPGGYTRILKLGPRKGDLAEMALIELVDYNEYVKTTQKKSKKKPKKVTNPFSNEVLNAPKSEVVQPVMDDMTVIDENLNESNDVAVSSEINAITDSVESSEINDISTPLETNDNSVTDIAVETDTTGNDDHEEAK